MWSSGGAALQTLPQVNQWLVFIPCVFPKQPIRAGELGGLQVCERRRSDDDEDMKELEVFLSQLLMFLDLLLNSCILVVFSLGLNSVLFIRM